MDSEKPLLKFVPFSSVISATFWESFSKCKLNDLRLSNEPVQISGIYSRWILDDVSPLLHIQFDSVSEKNDAQAGEIIVPGTLVTSNTIEEFKTRDKSELLGLVASKIWNAVISGDAVNNPPLLSSFLIYIYSDLKKYHYYYWCAFPAFLYPQSVEVLSCLSLDEKIQNLQLRQEIENLRNTNFDSAFFTLILENNEKVTISPLSSYYEKLKERSENCEVWLGFSDPSNAPNYPGWVLRNLLTLAAVQWHDIREHTIFSFRERVSSRVLSLGESIVFDVKICDEKWPGSEMPSALGWEKNERGKMGPKFTNMMKSMDPVHVAESSVELNLRLMKWRLDPDLNLEIIKKCRCLLIGAGTLGCNVARCLLNLTFVDGGKISFSNPVRQSLYEFQDCLEGKLKADTAAKAIQRIYPKANTKGVFLLIPMPGHTVSPSQLQQLTEDVKTLENLIDEHDAIFLLTDSRESRWLPTLIGASKKKIVLTAALGFDSYLVMRHGNPTDDVQENTETRVGCYFCNDVVAPGDSVSDRTLDQQCTVTKPGVSFMAAGHIVEILIEILQHSSRSKIEDNQTVPHSIRYFLGRMNQLITCSPAFKNCSACSPSVISAYIENGMDFLIQVFNAPSYLEEISGLKQLHEECQTVELYEFSDDSEEFMDQ